MKHPLDIAIRFVVKLACTLTFIFFLLNLTNVERTYGQRGLSFGLQKWIKCFENMASRPTGL